MTSLFLLCDRIHHSDDEYAVARYDLEIKNYEPIRSSFVLMPARSNLIPVASRSQEKKARSSFSSHLGRQSMLDMCEPIEK